PGAGSTNCLSPSRSCRNAPCPPPLSEGMPRQPSCPSSDRRGPWCEEPNPTRSTSLSTDSAPLLAGVKATPRRGGLRPTLTPAPPPTRAHTQTPATPPATTSLDTSNPFRNAARCGCGTRDWAICVGENSGLLRDGWTCP